VKVAPGAKVRIRARAWSIVPLSRVVIYRNGEVWKELPLAAPAQGKPCAEIDTEVQVDKSSWFTLYAEAPFSDLLDVRFPQAETNAVRVYAGDGKIRNRASAEYFIRWIDKLTSMADQWPMWRSEKERSHVLGQFAEARKVYQRLAAEAQE
jgi:hypothetical protein